MEEKEGGVPVPCRLVCPMTTEDAEAVAALIRLAFGPLTQTLIPPPTAVRVDAGDIRAHLSLGGGAIFMAGPVIAGCILWREQDGGLYLSRLSVHPAFRRSGIARRLLSAAEEEGVRQKQCRLHLGVRLALPGNRRLFAAAGFVETRRHAHAGYTKETWVEAEKILPQPPVRG